MTLRTATTGTYKQRVIKRQISERFKTLCFSSEDEEPEKPKPNKGEDVPKG